MTHPIYDIDPHFTLNLDTRALVTEMKKVSLMKGDHNSERFTFTFPAEIEGHRVEDCDKIEVHYINIDFTTKEPSKGVYRVEDLQPHQDDPEKVVFSWLIDGSATKYQGSLSFVVRLSCVDGNTMLYVWNTAIYTGITISDGINNDGAVIEECISILTQWEQELKANQIVNIEQTAVSTEDNGENVWTATFGDGRTQELKVRNGSKGSTGLVGSIETIQGDILHFFVGSQEEYEALSFEQKSNLFAIVTDDTTKDGLLEAIKQLNAFKDSILLGDNVAKKAEQDAEGNDIPKTYATKEELRKLESGETTVKKAEQISLTAETYASSQGIVSDLSLEANTLYLVTGCATYGYGAEKYFQLLLYVGDTSISNREFVSVPSFCNSHSDGSIITSEPVYCLYNEKDAGSGVYNQLKIRHRTEAGGWGSVAIKSGTLTIMKLANTVISWGD